jgi:hypothetical protein
MDLSLSDHHAQILSISVSDFGNIPHRNKRKDSLVKLMLGISLLIKSGCLARSL